MCCFFFNDTATTEIYTLSLHDALPISLSWRSRPCSPASCSTRAETPPSRWTACSSTAPSAGQRCPAARRPASSRPSNCATRSEEHTSELQSRQYLVCRLLLEKKKHNVILYGLNLNDKNPLNARYTHDHLDVIPGIDLCFAVGNLPNTVGTTASQPLYIMWY